MTQIEALRLERDLNETAWLNMERFSYGANFVNGKWVVSKFLKRGTKRIFLENIA